MTLQGVSLGAWVQAQRLGWEQRLPAHAWMCVVLRGQLSLTEDGAALLDLDGTNVLLDLADPLPEDAADTWVELFVDREKVGLYPYVL